MSQPCIEGQNVYCQTSVYVLRLEIDFVLPLSQEEEQEEPPPPPHQNLQERITLSVFNLAQSLY